MLSLRSAKPSHGDYYVVTHDVATRLQAFRSAILSVPASTDPMFDRFHRALHLKMQDALPGVSVHTIHIDDLARSIWEKVKHLVNGHMVVSSCNEVAHVLPAKSFTLNINRLFDEKGDLVGYGSRPGCDPLADQFAQLVVQAGGRPVVLLEEGAFSGGTIRHVLGELKARGIEVSLLVVGFCTPATRDHIKETFDGQLVVINELGELVDWITDHDLIPFTPGCGRVREKRTMDGNVCAYPYILPFGKMQEWSSLPDDIAHDLSKFCLDSSVTFFGAFDKVGGGPVTIGDLAASYPAVPIPIRVMASDEIPSLATEVVRFLTGIRASLD